MSVSFESLTIGSDYERPFLADLWGYKGFQAISRGVITPSGTNIIILFVTKEKQATLTQYHDYIDGDLLYWEGEEQHSSDSRILRAGSTGDTIHLFYRDVHHTPFTYYGEVFLKDHEVLTTEPSKFTFTIGSIDQTIDILDEIESHEHQFKSLDQTEREAVVKSRIGQGAFRDGLIELWGGCSVTGLTNLSLLRASHIKPWRDSTNTERIDPMNGLLLQPTLDHLFDAGFITFDQNGTIQVSPKLSYADAQTLHISSGLRLRKLNPETMQYLVYHRAKVYAN